MDNEIFELPVKRTAICHTEGCVNDGVAITRPLVTTVLCGGCGEFITDVKEA